MTSVTVRSTHNAGIPYGLDRHEQLEIPEQRIVEDLLGGSDQSWRHAGTSAETAHQGVICDAMQSPAASMVRSQQVCSGREPLDNHRLLAVLLLPLTIPPEFAHQIRASAGCRAALACANRGDKFAGNQDP